MIDNIQFISVKEVLSRVTRHPMLQDVDFEAGVQYTLDFIARVGLPNIYVDKQACVEIHDYAGMLPCGLIRVIQVRNEKSGLCMRQMTDSFNGNSRHLPSEDTFKTQGRRIITSFKDGKVTVAYKAIPVDDDEMPLLPDHPVFLKALELYIKNEVFTVLFDQGRIKADVMNKATQDYTYEKGLCRAIFKTPSESEMQSITGMMHRLVPSPREFKMGFKGLGDTETHIH